MQRLPSSAHDETLEARTAFKRALNFTFTRGVEETVQLDPSGGRLTQDGRRAMRWDGSLTIPVDAELLPIGPEDLLTPFGTRVAADLGVERYDGTVSTVPFGRYVVAASKPQIAPGSRVVEVTLADVASAVADYRFENAFTIPASTDLADAVNAVILNRTGATPELDTVGETLPRQLVMGLDPQKDPWRELQDLVAGFGYRLWYDRSGNLVLDIQPTPSLINSVTLRGATTVAGAFEKRPPNVAVARGEPADLPPVQAVVYDDDPSSPTYAGNSPGDSPYGRVTTFYSSPLITTQGGANAAGTSILARSVGAGATWQADRQFDPRFDPDDVLTVAVADRTLGLVVDAITVDIAGGTSMVCRAPTSLIVVPEEEGSPGGSG